MKVIVLLIAAASSTIPAAAGPQARADTSLAAGCVIRELSRTVYRVSPTRWYYVYPQALAVNAAGDVFTAGKIILQYDSVDGHWKPTDRPDLLGAIVRRDGEVRVVPAPPFGGALTQVKVLATGDSSWLVVMTSHAPDDTAQAGWPRRGTSGALVGTFEGGAWRDVRRIEAPAGVLLSGAQISAVVQKGDTIFWGARTHDSNGYVVFQRHAGRWRTHVIPQFNGEGELAYIDGIGPVLAFVYPDPTRRVDSNSLFFWTRASEWRRHSLIAPGGSWPNYSPRWGTGPSTAVVGWMVSHGGFSATSRNEIHAAWILDHSGRPSPPIVIDTGVIPQSWGTPIQLGDRLAAWITSARVKDGTLELRIHAATPAGAATLWRSPSPLAAFGTAGGNREIVASGLALGPTRLGVTRYVMSMLIRFRISCPGSW